MLKDRFCGFRWNDLSKQLRQSNCDKDIRTAIHTKLSFNVWRLGEGCLTDAQFSHGISLAAFAKPLLCAGRFISTNFNLKTKCCQKTKQTN